MIICHFQQAEEEQEEEENEDEKKKFKQNASSHSAAYPQQTVKPACTERRADDRHLCNIKLLIMIWI